MADAANQWKDRQTPHYHLYQKESFLAASHGNPPLFSTDPAKLEELAKQKLTEGGWLYASSNAGQSLTHLANRQAFFRRRLVPRMCVDTTKRETSTTLFDYTIPAPICFAPIGVNSIYHPSGELPVAKVAGELGLPYSLSTAGSKSIEAVAKANGASNPRFFQLYMPHDDELTTSMLERAWKSGFGVCILTVDTWQLGWRHDDVQTGNYAFYKGQSLEFGLADPVFRRRLEEAGIDVSETERVGERWIDSVWHGRAHTWEKVRWVVGLWKKISGGRPFVLKGVQSVEDARKAVDVGCDGIVVSNHAGRQVDGAIASLDALEKIAGAVGEDTTVLFDSGVRSGSDVAKALALGAKAVFVGRMWVWGLSIYGEYGVRHVMKSLLAEFDLTMAVGGFTRVEEFDKTCIDTLPGESLIAEKSRI